MKKFTIIVADSSRTRVLPGISTGGAGAGGHAYQDETGP